MLLLDEPYTHTRSLSPPPIACRRVGFVKIYMYLYQQELVFISRLKQVCTRFSTAVVKITLKLEMNDKGAGRVCEVDGVRREPC